MAFSWLFGTFYKIDFYDVMDDLLENIRIVECFF